MKLLLPIITNKLVTLSASFLSLLSPLPLTYGHLLSWSILPPMLPGTHPLLSPTLHHHLTAGLLQNVLDFES